MDAKKKRLRPAARSLPQVLREFLTPEVFKQVRRLLSPRKQPRWDIHPLLYVLLLMSWCAGDSLAEKFEVARGCYVACCPKRKRPGKSLAGFEKALAKLPLPVLRALATAMRTRIEAVFGQRLWFGGFIPLGCDGSQQETPRSAELERRLGTFGNEGSAPMIWITAIVHLTLGIPWCWRLGRGGKASERSHLLHMIPKLPKLALIVTDAGYVGYEVVRQLLTAQVWFLMRMSSNATFYTLQETPLEAFREGLVFYWPKSSQDQGKPPLRGRLLRVTSRCRKVDVWLFTNVEDTQRLPLDVAGQLYRWRWENEGYFRTYKRTLKKLKLESRTLRLVHREAEASLIALQLLLAAGTRAVNPSPARGDELSVQCSPRRVLLEIRRELVAPRLRNDFASRLASALRERRPRSTAKQKRDWPRRKPHKPPNPPLLLKLTDELKAKIPQDLIAA